MVTSSPLVAALSPSGVADPPPGRAWTRHVLFALVYLGAVLASKYFRYADTEIAIAWPSVGVAAWWAINCRSRRGLALVAAVVFVVQVVGLGVVEGRPLLSAVLGGAANILAGPAVAPAIILLDRLLPVRTSENGGIRQLDGQVRVTRPRDVYLLLLASLMMVSLSKLLILVAIDHAGHAVSVTLYTGLVLRDLAGIILVAGIGLALCELANHWFTRRDVLESLAVVASTAVLLAFIFGPGENLPIVYVALLPLYWSATRLPVPLATLHAVFTSLLATALAYWVGPGPFGFTADTTIEQASAAQLFILICLLLSLIVSTTVQQGELFVSELQTVTSTIPDALLVVDKAGKATPVNARARDVVGAHGDETFMVRPLRMVDGPPLTWDTRPAGRALRGEEIRKMLVEFEEGARSGADRRIYSVSASPLFLPYHAEPELALLVYDDSTEAYLSMQRLERAHDEARLLFEHAPQGIATLDASGAILEANEALAELIGVPVDQMAGQRLDDFSVDGNLCQEIVSAMEEPGVSVQADRCLRSPSGEEKSVVMSFRSMAEDMNLATRVLVNVVDVTLRQELQELVLHMADHDDLTGVKNRRRLEHDLAVILSDAAPGTGHGALLMIDLDNFKRVNDVLGHHVGDEILVEVAEVLEESVAGAGSVARLGGDEFVVVLPDASRADAVDFSSQIVAAVNRRFENRPAVVCDVTASAGVVTFDEAEQRGVDPLILADQRLYEAKRKGRNRSVGGQSGDDPHQLVETPLHREQIERILASSALSLELQPILEVASGRVVLAEGLVRVAPAERVIPTGEFVRAVEYAGLGSRLDSWVMKEGIGLLPGLQRHRPEFRLTLNISAQSMGSGEVAGAIIGALTDHQVPPGSLVIELTESSPVTDFPAARAFQRRLRDHGVLWAIDDFGAGNDPYRTLRQLDFDLVKIDGQFVQGALSDDLDRGIVSTITQLAHSQGMETVAEFVSDERILQQVKQLGITYAQGYHIGASLPPPEFAAVHLADVVPSAVYVGGES
ncbi:bifunctional diguanylate cyclase/phosphodiesterase [Corynebacterium guangdongense]|uniref:Diguanylate cyclase (GGDEF)-like protein/PAS domain S-box-containing protein n=1 Tax=Corynebacterium guangdongense TaxID=1783348 RepID=A0ABU1ZVL7_9CORY|nr:EAL domain-containing protein [Corynebacterium guangdongense]MDR7328950.1 diguanylate cyclase (GGDEF)-like protein/PAS domain S-box-containing protein [Corynebacterium guangdongense]WJZ17523.1 Phytochrome-like protein cph2 [Corynebacterium guangdongense]